MEVIKFLQSFHNSILDYFFEGITMLGEAPTLIFFVVVIYWCFNKKKGFRIAFALIFSNVLNGSIKNLVNEVRPIGKEGIFSLRTETATGSSFPSGHTQNTTAFWTSLMIIYKNKILYLVGAIFIILVGISRLYLGVHWPHDVIFGAILGIISVALSIIIVNKIEEKRNLNYCLILVIPALLGLFFFKSEDYLKAAALSLGFYLGSLAESRYINFNPKAEGYKQAMKLLIGIVGVVLIEIIFKNIHLKHHISTFIIYSLWGFWFIAGAPYTFVKLGLSKK
ncbi:phosphatase PAP2 family protein [Clostridium sp. 19966]|uniref:phosphatase PAP2 family protein n=1 Tax=Clostridium sp. 19966 TaxID=2768166 RepID=UPI0028DEED3D|nr:phosphatase PAP2 family protein [Clostridium sp. 19966]MDT8715643.1 phosphatase PAP2 family protein [Clostridium sp. 19966]